MNIVEFTQTMASLSGIAMILLGSAWLKRMLKARY